MGYGPTDRRTDRRTDKASYRDAWTHLKSVCRQIGRCRVHDNPRFSGGNASLGVACLAGRLHLFLRDKCWLVIQSESKFWAMTSSLCPSVGPFVGHARLINRSTEIILLLAKKVYLKMHFLG